MKEWKEVKLSDYIKTNTSNINQAYEHNKITYLDTGSITSNKIESLQEYELKKAPSRAKRLVKHNDIIYSSVRPNQLHYGFIQNPSSNFVVSTGFVVIESIKNKIEPKFLFYYLTQKDTTEYLHSIAEASTSAYPSLKPSDIEALDILLPPLPEQRAIANVLSSLDDKIDLLHRQNKTLEAMAETLFRQWFVEEASEDWEEVKLGDLVEIKSGKGLKKDSFIDSGLYPILGANGEIGRTNDFLFNDKLLYTGRVGTLGNIFRIINKKVWLSDNTLIIKPLKYFNYIYFILKFACLEELNVGSTQPLIRQSDVKEIDVVFPQEKSLEFFEKISDIFFNKIESNSIQIRTLSNLRDTLLPKLMSGEVRVGV